MTPRLSPTVLIGGLVAGTLDILDAFIVSGLRGVSPARVLRYIASGVMGPAAAQGGVPMAMLGLVLHFVIALGAALTYFAVSRKVPLLVRHPVVSGLIFGLCVWAVMQHVIVPLSLVRQSTTSPTWPMLANTLGIHMFGVGLPIALAASWSARQPQQFGM